MNVSDLLCLEEPKDQNERGGGGREGWWEGGGGWGGSEVVEDVLRYATFVVSCFGCLGNVLSLVVLTRNRLRRSVDPQEHIVYSGLLSITISDLFFCVTIVPSISVSHHQVAFTFPLSFGLAYNVYGTGMLTTFSLLSTWFVVLTAGTRYLGICHPFKARHVFKRRTTTILFLLVMVTCVSLNLPSFWTVKVNEVTTEDCLLYVLDLGMFSHETSLGTSFMIVRFVAGVLVPFVLLVFFNFRLIVAIRRSENFGRSHVSRSSKDGTFPPQVENTQTILEAAQSVNRGKSLSLEGKKMLEFRDEPARSSGVIPKVSVSFKKFRKMADVMETLDSIDEDPRQTGKRETARNHKMASKKHQSNRMTIILISVTFFFIFLVLPSEVEDFLPKVWSKINAMSVADGQFSVNFENSSDFVPPAEHGIVQSRQITNLMHVIMFSCNFVFYTFLSSHFRQALREMFQECFRCQPSS